MADSRKSDSQGTDDSSSHVKPAANLSPATYYHDPVRQRRQRRWHIAKLVLNCVLWCFAFSLFVIALVIVSWFPYNGLDIGGHTIWAASASLAWTSAEILVLLWRRSLGRGIDIRWHLSIHLIMWCGCVVTAGIASFMLASPYWPQLYTAYSDPHKAFFVRWRVAIIEPHLFVLGLIHFVLFVRCCVEVNRANHEKQVARVFKALSRLNPHDEDHRVAPPPPVLLRGPEHPEAAQPVQQAKTSDILDIPLETLQHIPRRPVGGPISMPPVGTAPDSYRTLDPDVEANLKFMGPLPVESVGVNHKYPSRILGAKRVDREIALYPEAAIRRLSL